MIDLEQDGIKEASFIPSKHKNRYKILFNNGEQMSVISEPASSNYEIMPSCNSIFPKGFEDEVVMDDLSIEQVNYYIFRLAQKEG